MAVNVTRKYSEVVTNLDTDPTVNVTQQYVEVATNRVSYPFANVSRQYIEVITGVAANLEEQIFATTSGTSSAVGDMTHLEPHVTFNLSSVDILIVDEYTASTPPPNLSVANFTASALLLDSATPQTPADYSNYHISASALVADWLPSEKMSASVNGTSVAIGNLSQPLIVYGTSQLSALPYLIRPTGRRQIVKTAVVKITGTPPPPPPPTDGGPLPVTNITLTSAVGFGTRTVTSWHSDDYVSQFSDTDYLTSKSGWEPLTGSGKKSLARKLDSDSRVSGKPYMGLKSGDEMTSATYNAPLALNLGSKLNSLEPLYISAWVKMYNSVSAVAKGTWKIARLSNDLTLLDDVGNMVFTRMNDQFNVTTFNDENTIGYPFVVEDGTDDDYPEIGQGTWTRMEFVVIPSTVDELDGTIEVYKSDNDNLDAWELAELKFPAGVPDYTSAYPTNAPPWVADGGAGIYSRSDGSDKYEYVIFQNYIHGGSGANAVTSGTNSVFMDSLYVQRGSLKRVELADSSNYVSAKLREVQRVDAWSNAEISINLLRGALPNGNYYLHVIDENNDSMYYEAIELTSNGFILQA